MTWPSAPVCWLEGRRSVVTSTLALVVCGAPLAARAHEVAAAAVQAGWQVRVVATPAALAWIDEAQVVGITGGSVATTYRQPDQPKRGPRPTAVVVCPATFNTVNKLAAGVADNHAMGVLCEALGAGTPIVAVPMINNILWGHPALSRSLRDLASAGVTFVDVHTGRTDMLAAVRSGTGDQVVRAFDPRWAISPIEASAQAS
jgi:phosphopantothenoylcysteine synthetase/decarboxylase